MRPVVSLATRAALAVLALGAAASVSAQAPLGTTFVYQGRLLDAGAPASGLYDLRLTLFDAATEGNIVGAPGTVVREDVAVANGLFVVALDFGMAFGLQKRWLQIEVRSGNTTGDFTVLSPRQEVTPVPAATFASSAQTVAGLACVGGNVLKWAGSGWTCGVDDDTNSGGTVTAVTAGSGLNANGVPGGTIGTAGTLSVASGGITGAMIASGAVGSVHINPSEVQRRVLGACPAGKYLRSINDDGTVACEQAALVPVVSSSLEHPDVKIAAPAIAIGSDGLPVLAYHETTIGALKVLKCTTPTCTGTTASVVVDDNPERKPPSTTTPSIAVGPDGYPVIAYQGFVARPGLKVAKCSDYTCSGGRTISFVDFPENVQTGFNPSISFGVDGMAVIAHVGVSISPEIPQLRITKCANASCSSSTTTVLDNVALKYGSPISSAIGADGLPVVAYIGPGDALGVVRCSTAACSSGDNSLFTWLRVVGMNRPHVFIGDDGLPHLAYAGEDGTRLVKCTTASCGGLAYQQQLVDKRGLLGIAVGRENLWFITSGATYDRLIHCQDSQCSQASVTALTFFNHYSGCGATAMAVGPDGLPAVVGRCTTDESPLRFLKCPSESCR